MKMALASAVALGVLLAAPSHAQQQLHTTPMMPAPVIPLDQPVMATQDMTEDQLKAKLEEIGVEQPEAFDGRLVRARLADGFPVLVLAGPADFTPGQAVELSPDTFRERLAEGGLLEPQVVQLHFMRGRLGDNALLVMAGDGHWGSYPRVAREELERADVEQRLGNAGVEDAGELSGGLFRARTEAGGTLLMFLGPDDFAAGQSADVDDEAIMQTLRDAGLQDIEALDEVIVLRGILDDHAVIGFAGMPLVDVPATGTVRQ